MLKKLVKYGNSHALVIDKALLELLNIAEGSVVKIKTDGVSLIITPHTPVTQETVVQPFAPQEYMSNALLNHQKTWTKNPEEGQLYMRALMDVMSRYAEPMQKMKSPAFQKALEELDQKFGGNRLNPKYGKAFVTLRNKHIPEFAEMEKEVKELSEKYAIEEGKYLDKENRGIFSLSLVEFKRVHEKYAAVLQQVGQLQENPDYIHEAVLLAEKHNITKNTPEYIEEYTRLVSKYIPEYATYQNELKAIGESFIFS